MKAAPDGGQKDDGGDDHEQNASRRRDARTPYASHRERFEKRTATATRLTTEAAHHTHEDRGGPIAVPAHEAPSQEPEDAKE
jgi:hypothetical protein